MKKLIILVFLFFFPTILFSQMQLGDNEIFDLYHKNVLVGQIMVGELKQLMIASGILYQERLAEEEGRIKVFLKDDPMNIIVGETFETTIEIKWYDSDGEIIKAIELNYEILVKKEAMSKFRIIYRDISEIGFPVSVLINIILGIITALAVL